MRFACLHDQRDLVWRFLTSQTVSLIFYQSTQQSSIKIALIGIMVSPVHQILPDLQTAMGHLAQELWLATSAHEWLWPQPRIAWLLPWAVVSDGCKDQIGQPSKHVTKWHRKDSPSTNSYCECKQVKQWSGMLTKDISHWYCSWNWKSSVACSWSVKMGPCSHDMHRNWACDQDWPMKSNIHTKARPC